MNAERELSRGRRVLVTHLRLAEEAVKMLHDNDVDVLFTAPYTPEDELVKKAAEWQVDAMIVRQCTITAPVIAASKKLRVIAKHGVGVDNIDIKSAFEHGIPVVRGVGSNSRAVAELAITLAVALFKELPKLDASMKHGEWIKPNFIGKDIQGSVLGLVGFGSIGQEVAKLGLALGFRVIAHDPHGKSAINAFDPAISRSLDALLSEADIVSLHCPLTQETREMISAPQLARMKQGSVLINTARGGLINETDVCAALHSGHLGGAGLDSFTQEPANPESALWLAPNLIASPHVAGVTHGATRTMAVMAAQQVIDILNGGEPIPRNLVSISESATA